MIKGKWKLLICTILVTCVLFVASNSVFAAINEEYYKDNVQDNVVVDTGLDAKLSNSVLVDALGSLIYGIGSLLEWVLGKFFALITGTNIFPWADAILFNAIPFLDINVFNPSGMSFVSRVQDYIAGTYYTVLTLASAFFGIAVMVSAVKLVLTAIAEDKARYKKAIVDWLLGLVMLWGIHFFISFALYLNEELVAVASRLATTSISGASANIIALADTSEFNQNVVANFVDLMEQSPSTLGDWLGTIAMVLGAIIIIAVVIVISVATGGTGTAPAAIGAGALLKLIGWGVVGSAIYISGMVYNIDMVSKQLASDWTAAAISLSLGSTDELVAKIDVGLDYEDMKTWLYATKHTYTDSNNKTYTYDPVNIAAALLKSDTYQELRGFKDLAGDGGFWTLGKSGSESHIKILFFDAYQIVGTMKVTNKNNSADVEEGIPAIDFYKSVVTLYDALPKSERITSGDDKNYDEDIHKLYSIYVNTYEAYVTKEASETNVFSNLAAYFKETAWSTSETGWKANKSVIQNALMYAILVVQSLIFFIAYVKRLFYVIMLILMAPVVVVFDFFNKFGK